MKPRGYGIQVPAENRREHPRPQHKVFSRGSISRSPQAFHRIRYLHHTFSSQSKSLRTRSRSRLAVGNTTLVELELDFDLAGSVK